ncbi:hypothetical protein GE061_004236 [Apolygus lucorum]|uniref:Isopropylmalate dehydrogenase-like domain-containing protein n=1 Tax=Apolygus lucorum TaxID=248454 RepID=A0A6A4INW0_APOLU|nr:hypothetical protein GE061_004236 [Apolygus lucorum]
MILYQRTKVVLRGLKTTCFNYARPVKVPPAMSESHIPFFDPWFDSSPRGTQPRTKAGCKYTITIIPGVGIGREMIESALEVLECCGAPVIPEWIYDSESDNDVNFMQMSVNRNGVGIKGNIENRSTWQIVKEDTESRNFVFQEALDLYAHVTVLKSFPSLKKISKIHRDMDIVVIRSNTEGEFALLEHQVGPGIYEHLRVISAYNTRRVSEFAFRKAESEGRKKVTVLHQSNTMPLSEGAFVEEFLKVARKFPKIEHEVMSIHQAARQIYEDLKPLDVIVSNSVYCTQLTDFLIGMIGGPRLVGGGSFSHRFAVFQPPINSRSRGLVGKGEANPTAFLLCGAYALDHLGIKNMGQVIRDAIDCAFGCDVMTKDMGGKATTKEFVHQIVKHVQAVISQVSCKYDKPPKIHPKLPAEWAPEKSGLFLQPVKGKSQAKADDIKNCRKT